MAKRQKKKISLGWVVAIIFLGFANLWMLLSYMIDGKNIAVMNPKGYIAQEQHKLLLLTTGILLLIAIPSLLLFYFVAWRYRENGKNAVITPHKNASRSLVFWMWAVPMIFAIAVGAYLVPATHKLSPNKQIESDAEPLTIQVIALRWKWLFLYPEQQIATVNFVQIPEDRPITFEMTADEAPMGSFWIPNLGGQLYTMTSHINRLNLMADTVGDYPGSTPEITGEGFTGMKFTTRVSTQEEFDGWVRIVKQSPQTMTEVDYSELVRPSENDQMAMYASFDKDIYDNVILKYNSSHEGSAHH